MKINHKLFTICDLSALWVFGQFPNIEESMFANPGYSLRWFLYCANPDYSLRWFLY